MATTNRPTITEHVRRTGQAWEYQFHRVDRWGQQRPVDLWLTAVLVAVVDVTITLLGLQGGLVEVNPIARASLVLFGVWSLLLLKGVALGIGALNCHLVDRRGYLVPTTFILIWGTAALSNLVLLLTHP